MKLSNLTLQGFAYVLILTLMRTVRLILIIAKFTREYLKVEGSKMVGGEV